MLPWLLHHELLRNCGLHPTSKAMDADEIMIMRAALFADSIILSLLLVAIRWTKYARFSDLMALTACLPYPWLILTLVAFLFTPLDGLWYRGVINALASLSLPVSLWILCAAALAILRNAGTRIRNDSELASQKLEE